MFPKSGKFKYSFENGKPWQSENLYAPFNFAVLKNSIDLEKEIKDIQINTPVYFNQTINPQLLDSITNNSIEYLFQNLVKTSSEDSIINSVKLIVQAIYNKRFAD